MDEQNLEWIFILPPLSTTTDLLRYVPRATYLFMIVVEDCVLAIALFILFVTCGFVLCDMYLQRWIIKVRIEASIQEHSNRYNTERASIVESLQAEMTQTADYTWFEWFIILLYINQTMFEIP